MWLSPHSKPEAGVSVGVCLCYSTVIVPCLERERACEAAAIAGGHKPGCFNSGVTDKNARFTGLEADQAVSCLIQCLLHGEFHSPFFWHIVDAVVIQERCFLLLLFKSES